MDSSRQLITTPELGHDEADNDATEEYRIAVSNAVGSNIKGVPEEQPLENNELAEQAKELLADSDRSDPNAPRLMELQVYKARWIVLSVVTILNASNAMSWIAFAPIANFVDEFYETGDAANAYSIIFLVCTIPVGIIGMWSARRHGLRTAILLAGWFNGIGAALRLLSSFVPGAARFPVGITGQGIAACAYPFIMFLPTKVAGAWFPDHQRGLCTTIAAMANPVGVLLANLISPAMVHDVSDVVFVNATTFVPCAIGCVLATVAVRSSEPPKPPTTSAGTEQLPFGDGMKKVLTSRAFIILMIVMGGGMGMFNCLYTIMQQLLCPQGYSNSFSGACCALMIVGGVFGATASSIFVDRTKKYEETMKVAFALAVVCGLLFVQLSMRSHLAPLIATCCALFGVLGLATYPVGLQMGAECTFPVSETTSTGLIVISGQIQSTIYVVLMSKLSQPLDESKMFVQVCSVESGGVVEARDMTVPALTFSGIATVLAVFFVIFFRPKLRRMNIEADHVTAGLKAKEECENGKSEIKTIA